MTVRLLLAGHAQRALRLVGRAEYQAYNLQSTLRVIREVSSDSTACTASWWPPLAPLCLTLRLTLCLTLCLTLRPLPQHPAHAPLQLGPAAPHAVPAAAAPGPRPPAAGSRCASRCARCRSARPTPPCSWAPLRLTLCPLPQSPAHALLLLGPAAPHAVPHAVPAAAAPGPRPPGSGPPAGAAPAGVRGCWAHHG